MVNGASVITTAIEIWNVICTIPYHDVPICKNFIIVVTMLLFHWHSKKMIFFQWPWGLQKHCKPIVGKFFVLNCPKLHPKK